MNQLTDVLLIIAAIVIILVALEKLGVHIFHKWGNWYTKKIHWVDAGYTGTYQFHKCKICGFEKSNNWIAN